MRSTTDFDVRTTMGELMYLIKLNTDLYELYDSNYEWIHSKGIFVLFSLKTYLKTVREQDKLRFAMNKNVIKEWNPRMKLLKDNLFCFQEDMKLYNILFELKRLDKTMQKMTVFRINTSNFKSEIYSDLKMVEKAAAIAGLTAVPLQD